MTIPGGYGLLRVILYYEGTLRTRDFTKNTPSKTLKPVGITNVFPRVKNIFPTLGLFLVKSRGRNCPSNLMVVICTPAVWSNEAYTIDDIIYF